MVETDAAVAEAEATPFDYPITVEDAGPATKRVTIEIPQDRIKGKLDEQFEELRSQAALPGFRPGRAPAGLLRKKFAGEVKDQVAQELIRESYAQAIEKHELQPIGEPEVEGDDKEIKLPDDGALTFSFTIEVQPDVTLPDFGELTVKKPKIEVTEEHVQQALKNLKEQQGTLVPVEDRGIEEGDYLLCDVSVKADGNPIGSQDNAQLVARPGRLAGLQIDDLAARLAGAKPGDVKQFDLTVPEADPRESIRGKQATVEITVKELKRLEPREIDDAFLAELGIENHDELMQALREEMDLKIENDIRESMHRQVRAFLLSKVDFELPLKLTARQEQRVVNQRAVGLMMRGVQREQIEQNIGRLKTGARDEARNELKTFFILQKIATQENIDVDENEVNGQIAMTAIQRGQRPEKLKAEMQENGQLQNLYVQLREGKTIQKIIDEKAKVEEVELPSGSDVGGNAEQAIAQATGEQLDATLGNEAAPAEQTDEATDAEGGEGEQKA
ncbi:MAG: trigger factor [Phycisphaerae bacterium]